MDTGTLTYSINIGALVIEFDVFLESFLQQTRAYLGAHGPDFIFAAGTMWVRIGETRHIVASEFHVGNIVEMLKLLAARIASPASLTSSARVVVPEVGVCAWMAQYWRLVADEKSSAENERLYDLLFARCIVAERDGCVAIYDDDGVPTVDITADRGSGGTPPHCMSAFDPKITGREVGELRQAIVEEIRQRMTKH